MIGEQGIGESGVGAPGIGEQGELDAEPRVTKGTVKAHKRSS